LSYFREYARDTSPDLFFKVYNGKELIKSTEDSVIWNAGEQTETEIFVDMPSERPEGHDYVSSEHIFNYISFFSKSDFAGYQKQAGEKVQRNLSMLKDIFKNTLNKMDIDPVRLTGPRIDEVIGQDVGVARKNLAGKKIEVKEVRDYNPRLNKEYLKQVTSLPVDLKANQKVILYEENGKVKYYSVESFQQRNNLEIAGRIDLQEKEIENLRKELKLAKAREDEKDKLIIRLTESTEALKSEQVKIWNTINKGIIRKPADLKKKSPSSGRGIKKGGTK